MKTITREGIKRIVGPVSGSGGSRGAGGGDISLAGLASEAWVEENYISKAFFNRLFTIHSASGVIDPNDPDEEQTIDSIEALVGFWTEEYVSALGQNAGGGGGGGGGGVTLNQPLEAINNAGLSAPTTAGTALVWYNGSWTYSPGARLQIAGINSTGTVQVSSSVTANSFIKTGGTSSMFLKADGSVDTNTYASETWVSQNYVSIQFFETLFNAINAQGVKVNANSITGIDSIKAMFGLWTERYLSALGQNSGGGGGGGVTLNQPLSGINNAGMNAPGTAGSLLVWNGTTWTYSAAASIIATTATFYGNSYAAGFAVTNKDNTYVLLAGGGTKLLSELGGHTSVSYNGNVYSPSSGVVALGYLTTSVKVNSSTYSVNSSGLVDIGSVVTAVKIAGTQTPYSPTAGVVEIPAYPTIPTNVSAFTNDAGYVSTSVSLSDPHLVLASPSGSGGPATFRALVASDIPDLSSIYATSDTWRTVQCNGVSIGNNTLNLVAGTNVAISASNGTLTFSSTDTNTLNTAGAVQLGSTKLYLVGAASQTDGVQTYSNVNCYIGTDGCLYSAGSKVMTAASGYLPLTGGTMTGTISFTTQNKTISFVGGEYFNSAGNLFLGSTSTAWGVFISSSNALIYARLSDGHVGIGTTNPYQSLSVVGDISTTSQFVSWVANGTAPLYTLSTTVCTNLNADLLDGHHASDFSTTDTKNTAGATANEGSKLWIVGAGAYNQNNSVTYTNTYCYIGTDNCLYSNGSKVMTDASGYLPLTGGTMTGTISFTTQNKTISFVGGEYFNSAGNFFLGTNSGAWGVFNIVNNASNALLYLVNSTGNFGIGINSPLHKLHINGNLAVNDIYIRTTDFHVYNASNYHFLEVNDTDKYIQYGYGTTANGYETYIGGKIIHLRASVSNSEVARVTSTGLWVGTTDGGTYKLYVNGNAGGMSAWANLSDMRLKDFIGNVNIEFADIAQIPLFFYKWKDTTIDTDLHIGTSAQYWEKIAPEVVTKGPSGTLGMQYGVAALVAAVLTARKVSEHEQRIAELERENKVLWNMIATLKAS